MGNLQRRFVGRFGLFDQTSVHWKFHKGTTAGRTTKALSAAHFAHSLETLKKTIIEFFHRSNRLHFIRFIKSNLFYLNKKLY